MSRTLAVIAAVTFLSALSLQPLLATNEEQMFATIDPTISLIRMGGLWQDQGRRGHYRAVIQTRCSAEHCYDRLFVQWLVDAPAAVARTIYISEVGNQTHITDVLFVPGKNGTRMEVQHQAAGERWVRCLQLDSKGSYAHKDSPCSTDP